MLKPYQLRHTLPAICLALSCILLFIIRMPSISNPQISQDEATYMSVGQQWSEGFLPYTTTFEIKPPIAYIPYLIANLIPGDPFINIHILSLATIVISLMLLCLISHKLHLNSPSIIVLLTAFALLSSLEEGCLGFMTEHLSNLLLLSALFLIIEGDKPLPSDHDERSASLTLRPLLCGVFLSCSVLTRTNYLLLIPIFMAYYCNIWLSNKQRPRSLQILRSRLLVFFIGFSAPLLIIFLYYYFNNETYSLYAGLKSPFGNSPGSRFPLVGPIYNSITSQSRYYLSTIASKSVNWPKLTMSYNLLKILFMITTLPTISYYLSMYFKHAKRYNLILRKSNHTSMNIVFLSSLGLMILASIYLTGVYHSHYDLQYIWIFIITMLLACKSNNYVPTLVLASTLIAISFSLSALEYSSMKTLNTIDKLRSDQFTKQLSELLPTNGNIWFLRGHFAATRLKIAPIFPPLVHPSTVGKPKILSTFRSADNNLEHIYKLIDGIKPIIVLPRSKSNMKYLIQQPWLYNNVRLLLSEDYSIAWSSQEYVIFQPVDSSNRLKDRTSP
jgi:hypothetical protein